jgi:hypothetical protein
MRDVELYQAVLSLLDPWAVVSVGPDVTGQQATVNRRRGTRAVSVSRVPGDGPLSMIRNPTDWTLGHLPIYDLDSDRGVARELSDAWG